jgi:hypothetical protein
MRTEKRCLYSCSDPSCLLNAAIAGTLVYNISADRRDSEVLVRNLAMHILYNRSFSFIEILWIYDSKRSRATASAFIMSGYMIWPVLTQWSQALWSFSYPWKEEWRRSCSSSSLQ